MEQNRNCCRNGQNRCYYNQGTSVKYTASSGSKPRSCDSGTATSVRTDRPLGMAYIPEHGKTVRCKMRNDGGHHVQGSQSDILRGKGEIAMNKMNKKQLLRFITEVSFALDDIALYLDLHPDCTKALSSYDNYQSMRTQAINDYVNMYGPLNKYQVTDNNYFNWVNDPWPWEGECNC